MDACDKEHLDAFYQRKSVQGVYKYSTCIDVELYKINNYIDWLVQERHNSIANALEFCLFGTNPWT